MINVGAASLSAGSALCVLVAAFWQAWEPRPNVGSLPWCSATPALDHFAYTPAETLFDVSSVMGYMIAWRASAPLVAAAYLSFLLAA